MAESNAPHPDYNAAGFDYFYGRPTSDSGLNGSVRQEIGNLPFHWFSPFQAPDVFSNSSRFRFPGQTMHNVQSSFDQAAAPNPMAQRQPQPQRQPQLSISSQQQGWQQNAQHQQQSANDNRYQSDSGPSFQIPLMFNMPTPSIYIPAPGTAVNGYSPVLAYEPNVAVNIHNYNVALFTLCSKFDWIVSVSEDNIIFMWDYVTGKFVEQIVCHRAPVNAVGFTNNGMYVTTSDVNGVCVLHEILTRPMSGGRVFLRKAAEVHLADDQPFDWINWNDFVIVGKPRGVILVKSFNGQNWISKALSYCENFPPIALKFTDCGHRMYVAYADDVIIGWNLVTGLMDFEWTALLDERRCGRDYLVFSPFKDQYLLATNTKENNIAIWDFHVAQIVAEIVHPPFETVSRVIWLSYAVIAVGTKTGKVFGYKIPTGEMMFVLIGHTTPIVCMGYNPEKNVMATSSGRTIHIYQIPRQD